MGCGKQREATAPTQSLVKLQPWFLRLQWRTCPYAGSLIWSKTLMELIFNPCGEFWWSPEGPVSQIYSPHLHLAVPGIVPDLLRSIQVLKESRVWKETGRYRRIYSSLVKLQPWFLSLRWKTCPWAEHYDIYMNLNHSVICCLLYLLCNIIQYFVFVATSLRGSSVK